MANKKQEVDMMIGARIRYVREQHGWSQQELAERSGFVSRASINKIESGQRNLTQARIAKVADALGVEPSYLMGWDEDSHRVPPGFRDVPEVRQVPVLGGIACGQPMLAVEDVERFTQVPVEVHCDFALDAHGDSMIDAGIHDGDIVYIRRQDTVENGQIAAVLIGTEATLKRVYMAGDTVTLMPCNPLYPPMVYRSEDEEMRIQGLVVGYTHIYR